MKKNICDILHVTTGFNDCLHRNPWPQYKKSKFVIQPYTASNPFTHNLNRDSSSTCCHACEKKLFRGWIAVPKSIFQDPTEPLMRRYIDLYYWWYLYDWPINITLNKTFHKCHNGPIIEKHTTHNSCQSQLEDKKKWKKILQTYSSTKSKTYLSMYVTKNLVCEESY